MKTFDVSKLSEYGLAESITNCIINSGITFLREIQYEALINGLFDRLSFLIVSPSGSGKTLIGEVAALHTIFQYNQKALYLVPLRALASEKFHNFKDKYRDLSLEMVYCVGDQDVFPRELRKAHLLIMTFEKFDAYLRSGKDFDWITLIGSVIIDEIHLLSEYNRGPRLENLILRLYHLPYPPQIVSLSATIANPASIGDWFRKIEKKYRHLPFHTISSFSRPVPLHHHIIIVKNKLSMIQNIIIKNLSKNGQILIFTNSRNDTQILADELKDFLEISGIIDKKLDLKEEFPDLLRIYGDLPFKIQKLIEVRICYHHAGLNVNERFLIEELFRRGALKIICTTNTLSAGINTPARSVILKEYEIYQVEETDLIVSGRPQLNFHKFPIKRNLFHQICGRAGRPGFDKSGYAYIFAKSADEMVWIEEQYFIRQPNNKLTPKYDKLQSNLSRNRDLMLEIVLLKIYESEQFHIDNFIDFIQDSLMYEELKQNKIPLTGFLNLQKLDFLTMVKTLGNARFHDIYQNCQISTNVLDFQSHQKIICSIKIENRFQNDLEEHLNHKFFSKLPLDYKISLSLDSGFEIFNQKRASRKEESSLIDNSHPVQISLLEYFCLLELKKLWDYEFLKIHDVGVESFIPSNNYKKLVKNISQLEEFVYNCLFPKPLIQELQEFGMVEIHDPNTSDINYTSLGEITLQTYIEPVLAYNIASKIKNINISRENDVLQVLIPILQSGIAYKMNKTFQSLLEIIQFWIEEFTPEKILDRIKTQNPQIRLFRNDIVSILEHITRIFKFIREYFRITEKMISHDIIDKFYYRIKYGILPDLVPWARMFKSVDPRTFRALIQLGITDPSQILQFSPIYLAEIMSIPTDELNRIIAQIS